MKRRIDWEVLARLPRTALQTLRYLLRKLWVRVVLMGAMSLVALAGTQVVEPFVPEQMAKSLPGSAADRLLNIIANAMLAVTTFSLTVMVSVYRSSASQWTPRVHQLIMRDKVTQNTLAAFVGAYVYALVAIVMRETGIYVDDRAWVLFWLTVLVLVFVVWSLIRWVLHLQTLGSLVDTTRQVEDITRAQFEERLSTPCLGACPWDGTLPEDAQQLRADQTGYVQHIYPDALQDLAEKHDVALYLTRNVGSFVFLNEPLLWVCGDVEDMDELAEAVQQLVVLGDVRTYDQDPRFGLLVMSEIGSKALSPGVNDPGTAIDVLNRSARILSLYKDESTGDDPLHRNLHARPLDARDLIMDAFSGIARDGADDVIVQQRLQRCLSALMDHPDSELSAVSRDFARDCLNRALEAMDWPADRDALRDTADKRVLD